MVFDLSKNAILALFTIIAIWLAMVSFFLLRMITHYQRITAGISKKTLQEILEKILTRQQKTEGLLKNIDEQVDDLEKKTKAHIQKVGLIKFNPFSDTGGKQSFILSLLDHSDTGVIISSLFRRQGSRWYVKYVKNGKGIEHELSKEESDAIKKAQYHKN